MNKFNKGKLLGVVAASLSAVSLMGVGFATWIIGIQKTTTDGDVLLSADDVKYKALTISVDFQDTLTLAEEAKTGENVYFGSDGGKTPDMKIATVFTFNFGKDFTAAEFDFDNIELSIKAADTETGYIDNTVDVTNDKKIDRTGTSFTYFDLANKGLISFSKTDLGIDSLDVGANSLKTKTISTNVNFVWGTMFNGGGKTSSPTEFYNAGFNALTEDAAKKEYMGKAYEEMDAMHKKYTKTTDPAYEPKIKLDVKLVKKGA